MNQSDEATVGSPKGAAKGTAQRESTRRPSQDDDGFVAIQHADIDMPDSDPEQPESSPPVELFRFGHHFGAVDDALDDEDAGDDDHNPMASHPLLSMLTGRLGARRRGSAHKWDRLHPENQALSVSDVNQCTALEDAAFPPAERASREKFQYRLTRCPELSLGLFTQPTQAERQRSSATDARRRLIAHIVSTRSPAPSVTEASMGIPSNWQTRRSSLPTAADVEPVGHQDRGGTICLHSLAVDPEFQKMGLGSILIKSYVQRIKDSKCADRIALLAHDHLVPFYTSVGFENMGPSAVTSHGGNWNNMVLEFAHEDDD